VWGLDITEDAFTARAGGDLRVTGDAKRIVVLHGVNLDMLGVRPASTMGP